MAVRKYFDPRIVDLPFMARIVCDDLPAFAKFIMRRCDDRLIASMAAPWLNSQVVRSLDEVVENIRAELSFLFDPAVIEVLSPPSNFAPASLRRSVQTVFSLFPGELQDGPVAKFQSFISGCFFSETMRHDPLARTNVQVVLDEAFVLDVADLPRLFATSRRYGVHVWALFQDFSELRHLTEQTFSTVVGNAGTLQVLGVAPGNQQDAIFLSEALGETEVWSYNKSVSYDQMQFNIQPFGGNTDNFQVNRVPEWQELRSLHVTQSYSQQRRRFMMPQEITSLDPELQICWLHNVPAPVLCRKAPYFKTLARYRVEKNPLLRGK